MLDLCRARPEAIACDRQPDLYSTRLAHELAGRWGVPVLPIQHHHAHIAATLAEHGHQGPALGLALDGFGWGDDGGAWGGELLRVEAGHAQRLGHLTPLPLPGGDAAARQPARMALALLHRLDPDARRCPPDMDAATAARLHEQIARGFNCPPTSSLGRWFDAVAGLAGLGAQQSYSGEAAMKLEALAHPAAVLPAGWRIHENTGADGSPRLALDLLPLARHLARLCDPIEIASLWHATLAAALADWLRRAMAVTGLNVIALGGGCCANLILIRGLCQALGDSLRDGRYTLLQARCLPPGDDAISYGQAWAAIEQLGHH
jgi:hydrogenase maturation protein HypF